MKTKVYQNLAREPDASRNYVWKKLKIIVSCSLERILLKRHNYHVSRKKKKVFNIRNHYQHVMQCNIMKTIRSNP